MAVAAQNEDVRARYIAFLRDPSRRFPENVPDYDAITELREIASHWSSVGEHFYAGYVLWSAIHPAWGSEGGVVQCGLEAQREFEQVAGRPDLEGIAALQMWVTTMGSNYIGLDPSDVRSAVGGLREEMAQRLTQLAEKRPSLTARAGYMVYGFELTVDFSGQWEPHFPAFEVASNVIKLDPESITIGIPSAFQNFVRAGDYRAASDIATAFPEFFDSPGLRGWNAAIKGLLDADQSVERFTEAADEFARDVYDEERSQQRGHWSSINIDLWEKYFRARSMLAQVVRTPQRASDLVHQAAGALEGTDAGWVNPQVSCLRHLLTALDQVIGGSEADTVLAEATASLSRDAGFFGLDEADQLALEFFDSAAEAFRELGATPTRALTSGALRRALEILGRIPLIGDGVAASVEPVIGERAYERLLGRHMTWIYRTIESIKDERTLQRLLLRLMQGQLPLYAQVRHGPIEYGKDIVALVEANELPSLQMYQVKAGDITKANWPKARDELEEMFQVDMSSVQLPEVPDSREGILIFNGHLNPYVEPVVTGWLDEQERDHDRSITIMHIDRLVKWIVNKGLINELRHALDELRIPILDKPEEGTDSGDDAAQG
jgi:hypothetical protein